MPVKKIFLTFRAGQTSPILRLANGDYRRSFDIKDSPFECEPAEAKMLLKSGHFEEVKEPQTANAGAEVVASSKTEGHAGEGSRPRKKVRGKVGGDAPPPPDESDRPSS